MPNKPKDSPIMVILQSVDWRQLLLQSELFQALLRQPETIQFLQSMLGVRAGLARALVEVGAITEDDTRPVKEGGMSLAAMLQRAVELTNPTKETKRDRRSK